MINQLNDNFQMNQLFHSHWLALLSAVKSMSYHGDGLQCVSVSGIWARLCEGLDTLLTKNLVGS